MYGSASPDVKAFAKTRAFCLLCRRGQGIRSPKSARSSRTYSAGRTLGRCPGGGVGAVNRQCFPTPAANAAWRVGRIASRRQAGSVSLEQRTRPGPARRAAGNRRAQCRGGSANHFRILHEPGFHGAACDRGSCARSQEQVHRVARRAPAGRVRHGTHSRGGQHPTQGPRAEDQVASSQEGDHRVLPRSVLRTVIRGGRCVAKARIFRAAPRRRLAAGLPIASTRSS